MSLYKPSELHQFLKELNIKPQKGLSQNFLIDGNILRKIVAAANIKPGDTVLEIGPGPGVLTEALLEAQANVIAIEKDEKLGLHLERFQNGHLQVLIDDFRNIDIKSFAQKEKKIKVIANIPYHITGIILQTLLPKREYIESIHLMVQEDVARRCTAKVGTKDYSSFTLFTQYHADPNFLHLVRNTSFYPPPKVDSAILELKLKPPPVKAPYDPLFGLIRAAFQMRRKMLRSSLKTFAPSSDIEKALETLGLSPTARPQELSLENFSALFFALNSINSEKDE